MFEFLFGKKKEPEPPRPKLDIDICRINEYISAGMITIYYIGNHIYVHLEGAGWGKSDMLTRDAIPKQLTENEAIQLTCNRLIKAYDDYLAEPKVTKDIQSLNQAISYCIAHRNAKAIIYTADIQATYHSLCGMLRALGLDFGGSSNFKTINMPNGCEITIDKPPSIGKVTYSPKEQLPFTDLGEKEND
jgi:hypothetical protein